MSIMVLLSSFALNAILFIVIEYISWFLLLIIFICLIWCSPEKRHFFIIIKCIFFNKIFLDSFCFFYLTIFNLKTIKFCSKTNKMCYLLTCYFIFKFSNDFFVNSCLNSWWMFFGVIWCVKLFLTSGAISS